MNARHTFLGPSLVAVALLMLGTSAVPAANHHPPKHSGQPPHHARQVHATHSGHGYLARPSVHPVHPSYRVRPPVATYHHPRPIHPIHPVYRHPAPVIVTRPLVVYPPVVHDATWIQIVNPAETGTTVSYAINGQPFFLEPGCAQTLHRRCVITYPRGYGYGGASLVLTGGTYTFGLGDDGGWSLWRN